MRAMLKVLQLIVSIAILAWVYSRVPIDDVMHTLGNARWPWVAIAAVFMLLLQLLVALRWRLLIAEANARASLAAIFGIQLASSFYKLFIPGGMIAAIGVRYYKLQRLGGSRPIALSSVVVDRLLATLGLGLVGTVAWLLDTPRVPSPVGWAIAGWLAAMLVILAIVLHPRLAAGARRIHATGRLRPITSRIVKLSDAFGLYRDTPGDRVAALAGYTALPHLAGVVAHWSCGRAVGVEVDLLTWAWLRAAVTLVASQPISLAGLGVRDVTVVWLLAFYGVGQEQGLAVAFLLLGVTVLLPAALGGLVESRALWRRSSDGRNRPKPR